MISFTNKAKTNTALNPGGFMTVSATENFSSAVVKSIQFAGSYGVETLVQSGGTSERSSACMVSLRHIGVNENSRGAVRSFRNFPETDRTKFQFRKRSMPGGASFGWN